MEDIDLCLKIRERGYKILFYPGIVVRHYLGISKKSNITKANIEAKKSQLYFYQKYNN